MTPVERAEVGTEVTLHLMADQRRYLDRKRLEHIVRTYADFLGVPVFIDDGDARATEPANAVDAPWHRRQDSASHERHVRE